MKQTRKILSVVAAAGMMLAAAPSMLWAESAAPTGNAAVDFLGFTGIYDPNAPGTKYSGTLAVAYGSGTATVCAQGSRSMYVVLTLQQGNLRIPFATQLLNFCFENQNAQVNAIVELIRNSVIPAFNNNCLPGPCPDFKVKSLTNFNYTAGANSSDITIAVR